MLQYIKNSVSNSHFIKKKTFRLQTSKLLGKRRKTYILDVICNRYYFGEVQEEVLGQCMCIFMYTCIYLCTCIHAYVYIYIATMCMCVCVYICWYVYIYVYMCVCMYMYIYTLTTQWTMAIKREYVFRDSLVLRKTPTIYFLTNFYLFSNCIMTTQYLKPLKITSLGEAKNNTLNNTYKKPEYLKTFLLYPL